MYIQIIIESIDHCLWIHLFDMLFVFYFILFYFTGLHWPRVTYLFAFYFYVFDGIVFFRFFSFVSILFLFFFFDVVYIFDYLRLFIHFDRLKCVLL